MAPAPADRSEGEGNQSAARPLDAGPGGRNRARTRHARSRVVPASRGRSDSVQRRRFSGADRRSGRFPATGISRCAECEGRRRRALRRSSRRRALRCAVRRAAAALAYRGLDARARARFRARRPQAYLPGHAETLRHQGSERRDDHLSAAPKRRIITTKGPSTSCT